ncbi:FapA family protein [Alkalicoccus daliensis]|uniref:RNA-binding protein KhpB N-terminal domain-containing protein n=1 Tax=Alkalicoccus daliensis TaxID=745820 RepID=A0A1H0E0N0_9BACI|nr:FapA family protein [Alkalicoccus daliensis]SDN75919.1 hypothetical protein SAMN04488053_103161 [Alkalicoccus daliensis]
MEKNHIFTGESVDEAVQVALAALNVAEESVDIKILQNEGPGFFGLGRTKAKIKVVHKMPSEETGWENMLQKYTAENTSSEERGEELQLNLDGKAWIKEGSLYFQDTAEQKPVLILPGGVTALKNGKPVEKKTILSQGDRLDFSLEKQARETSWSVKVDNQKQLVELRVTPGAYFVSTIEDAPPAANLYISTASQEIPLNQLTEKDIYEQLERMDIVEGICEEEIKAATRAERPASFIIAKGKLPVHGNNGKINFIIDIRQQSGNYKEKLDGTIDFRESIHIPTVNEGTVFASIIEPTPGEDGISVFGEVLKAKAGKPIQLAPGAGIEINEETNEVVAVSSGRPHVDQRGQSVRLSILPKLLHRGDLSLQDGNIHFIGDVEVHGSVHEQMMIEAAGDIWIHKNVDKASLQSSKSIIINANALNSKIVAGQSSAIYEEALKLLKQFLYNYPSFLKVFQQVTSSEAFQSSYNGKNGWGPLVKALQEKKFPEVKKSAEALTAYINAQKTLFEGKWKDFSDMIQYGLLTFHHKSPLAEDHFFEIERQAFQLHDVLESPSASSSRIALKYAAYSEMYCDGEVDILGKGAIHSHIYADGYVTIHQKFIGGKISAKKGMNIKEAGSPGGAKTLLQTDSTGVIKIEHAHPDVLLSVGGINHKIRMEEFYLTARLDSEGRMKISRNN